MAAQPDDDEEVVGRTRWLMDKLRALDPGEALPPEEDLYASVQELKTIADTESPEKLFGLYVSQRDHVSVSKVRIEAQAMLEHIEATCIAQWGAAGQEIFASMVDGTWESKQEQRILEKQAWRDEQRALYQKHAKERRMNAEPETVYEEGVARIAADHSLGDGANCDSALSRLLESDQPLHDLTLGWWYPYDANSYDTPLSLLATSAPALERLFVGDFSPEESEISWTEVGDVGQVMDAIPSLKVLKIRGGGVRIARTHEKLEELRIESGGLNGHCVRTLAGGDFPSMRVLRVWFGTDAYGGEATIDAFAPFFSNTGYPALRELGLENTLFSNEAAKRLVVSPLAAQLEVIHFSMGTMTDEGALVLAEGASAFPRLKRIFFTENFIGEKGAVALQEAFGKRLVFGLQEEPDDWDDELHYYVSVSE